MNSRVYCNTNFYLFFIFKSFIYQRILKKSITGFQKYEAAQLFPTLIINQHIRQISEGSCDTEDWTNDAENTALITEINYILKYIKLQ